jgi:hypothetical protein
MLGYLSTRHGKSNYYNMMFLSTGTFVRILQAQAWAYIHPWPKAGMWVMQVDSKAHRGPSGLFPTRTRLSVISQDLPLKKELYIFFFLLLQWSYFFGFKRKKRFLHSGNRSPLVTGKSVNISRNMGFPTTPPERQNWFGKVKLRGVICI